MVIKLLFNFIFLLQFFNTLYFENNLLKSFNFLKNFFIKFSVYFRNLKQFYLFIILFFWLFFNFIMFGYGFFNFLIIAFFSPISWIITTIFKVFIFIKFWNIIKFSGFGRFFIEIISISSRSISLTLRLFVNLFVGFLICHFLQFGKNIENLRYFNFFFTSLFTLFEVFIIYIQSFIFSFLVRRWLI